MQCADSSGEEKGPGCTEGVLSSQAGEKDTLGRMENAVPGVLVQNNQRSVTLAPRKTCGPTLSDGAYTDTWPARLSFNCQHMKNQEI